jgi:MFS family permease
MEEGSVTLKNFLIKAGIIVGSGGLIFGYDIGVISGTLSKLGSVFDLSPYEKGVVVAILYVGSILGAIIGGPLCDYVGRWKTIHIQNFLFCIGSFLTGFANSIAMLCVGRFIVGIASALSGIADVPYLNEIAPPEHRGVLSSQYEMAVSVGVLISFAVALALSGAEYGWRISFLIPSALALMQTAFMFLLPETPRWLMEKGLLDQAQRALGFMYGDKFLVHCAGLPRSHPDVPGEIVEYLAARDKEGKVTALQQAVAGTGATTGTGTTGVGGTEARVSLSSPLDISTDALEQGGNGNGNSHNHSNSNNSSRTNSDNPQHHQSQSQTLSQRHRTRSSSLALRALFQEEQEVLNEYRYPIYLIIIVQVLAQVTGGNVIRNYAPTIFEDGGVSVTLSLVFNLMFGVIKTIFTFLSIVYIEATGRLQLLVIGIYVVGAGMLFLAICSLTSTSGNISNVPAFVVGCAMVYAGFGLGYGPVPWVLSAEMFPTAIRGRIMSLPMTEGITTSGTFFLFVTLNVLTLLFTKKFLVETKEINYAEILKALHERYAHSWVKLLTAYPWFYEPLQRCFSCCLGTPEDVTAAANAQANAARNSRSSTGGVGGGGAVGSGALTVAVAKQSGQARGAGPDSTSSSSSSGVDNPLLGNGGSGNGSVTNSSSGGSSNTAATADSSRVGQSTSKIVKLSHT